MSDMKENDMRRFDAAIYTDESKIKDGVGGAFVVVKMKTKSQIVNIKKLKLAFISTVFQAELCALIEAQNLLN